jgi:hypothetical protein
MSQRYLGGVITANPTTPTLASLSGVWTLEQQFQNFNVWSPEIVGNSVRLRSSASAYFNRTPASASNRKTWTWSGWVKRGGLGARQTLFSVFDYLASPPTNNQTVIEFTAADTLGFFQFSTSTYNGQKTTTQVFRDPSAWYHIVAIWDTTQATASSRMRLFVNGVQITAFGTSSDPSLNADGEINRSVLHNIGTFYDPDFGAPSFNLDGYLTEINFIDGQALTPSSFGAYDSTGVWQPLPYTGTYGTNGFYLTFADNSAATAAALGKDTSGNGNNWTPNNISLTAGVTYDWMLDSPTNWIGAAGGTGVANYCVMNPLAKGSSVSITNGNLAYSSSSQSCYATIGVSSGKWYWEVVASTVGAGVVGIAGPSDSLTVDLGDVGAQRGLRLATGVKVGLGATVGSTATFSNGDIAGLALDLDSGELTIYKNGSSLGVTHTGITGTLVPAIGMYSATSASLIANFGQRPFSYTVPTGFKALNTLNLPTPTIMRGDAYFNVNLWTGDQTARTITNSGLMQPDFLWTKSRSNVEDHRLSDSVRGGNGTVLGTLASNTTGVEAFDTDVTGFTSTGFNIRAGTNSPNVTGRTYVGWQWQAGKGVTSSNANGTITSTVSVNTTAGFSVVSYTGNGSASATVGHGLGVAPAMVIVKSRGSTASWIVKHKNLSSNNVLFLEATNAQLSPSNGYVQDLSSSTTFGIVNGGGGVANVNTSSTAYIAYCFAAVTGYSAFGSYTGNGSTDGPFVYTGMRPRYILLKSSTQATDWWVVDTARSTANVATAWLNPNLSNAESSAISIDILSNGFKLRSAAGNDNGQTWIYACFAENPFNIARAR